jgi:hypothetical protein
MNCETFEELISAHLDGELTGAEGARFREHQLACASCRTLLDDVAAAVVACVELPPAEPPLELLSRSLVIPALNPPVDCGRFESLVTEFLDGYLEPIVYHAFEAHAHECENCSEILAGVALAVSVCHSVHFHEHEVPESLVDRILAETSGVAAREAREAGLAARVGRWMRISFGPTWVPRLGTAAFIVAAFTALVTDGALAPQTIYAQAARMTSRVYSQSADLAARTDQVLVEVERIRADVDDIIADEEKEK